MIGNYTYYAIILHWDAHPIPLFQNRMVGGTSQQDPDGTFPGTICHVFLLHNIDSRVGRYSNEGDLHSYPWVSVPQVLSAEATCRPSTWCDVSGLISRDWCHWWCRGRLTWQTVWVRPGVATGAEDEGHISTPRVGHFPCLRLKPWSGKYFIEVLVVGIMDPMNSLCTLLQKFFLTPTVTVEAYCIVYLPTIPYSRHPTRSTSPSSHRKLKNK